MRLMEPMGLTRINKVFPATLYFFLKKKCSLLCRFWKYHYLCTRNIKMMQTNYYMEQGAWSKGQEAVSETDAAKLSCLSVSDKKPLSLSSLADVVFFYRQ